MIRRRYILGCLIIIFGVLTLLFFTGNDSTGLVFSAESGFYDKPFELKLSAPVGTKIYYTLDGSDPDENALLYTKPISVDDATNHENVYCMRTDVTPGFSKELLESLGQPDPNYVIPDYFIDKCTIIKAVYCDAEGNFSDIKTESYFVNYDNKESYDDLNIISIVTDPDNLFDFDTGIYVLGKEYATGTKSKETSWPAWSANYHSRGIEWEREATIQIFNTKKELLLNQNCGIRIQGGGSRGRLPRSLNLYARDQYDDDSRFYVDLFDTGYMAKIITLSAGGDDAISKFRDMIYATLISDRNFASMNYSPYALFLNGEYWGVYWLTEKFDDVYLGYYYDVDKDNIVMVKKNVLSEGAPENYELYTEMMEYMSNTDLSIQDNYNHACDLIDMQSYIDYYAAQIYIARCHDWPLWNEALWRTCNLTADGKYNDGKWRWISYDVNSGALSSDLIEADTFITTLDNSAMFKNLCQNTVFKKQFTITFMDLVNTSFTKEKVDSIISDYIHDMKKPMSVHLKRFFGHEDTQLFLDAVADIQNFFDCRRPYIVQYLKEDFGLAGTLVPVEVSVNDLAAGHVTLNTIEPAFDADGTWSGEYFTDYPISLTAIPNDGYRFVRWENAICSENDYIEINLDESGTSVKAVFEKIEK